MHHRNPDMTAASITNRNPQNTNSVSLATETNIDCSIHRLKDRKMIYTKMKYDNNKGKMYKVLLIYYCLKVLGGNKTIIKAF